jgi:hypothetical protein
MKFYQWCLKGSAQWHLHQTVKSGAKLDISATMKGIFAKKKSQDSGKTFQALVGY